MPYQPTATCIPAVRKIKIAMTITVRQNSRLYISKVNCRGTSRETEIWSADLHKSVHIQFDLDPIIDLIVPRRDAHREMKCGLDQKLVSVAGWETRVTLGVEQNSIVRSLYSLYSRIENICGSLTVNDMLITGQTLKLPRMIIAPVKANVTHPSNVCEFF